MSTEDAEFDKSIENAERWMRDVAAAGLRWRTPNTSLPPTENRWDALKQQMDETVASEMARRVTEPTVKRWKAY